MCTELNLIIATARSSYREAAALPWTELTVHQASKEEVATFLMSHCKLQFLTDHKLAGLEKAAVTKYLKKAALHVLLDVYAEVLNEPCYLIGNPELPEPEVRGGRGRGRGAPPCAASAAWAGLVHTQREPPTRARALKYG